MSASDEPMIRSIRSLAAAAMLLGGPAWAGSTWHVDDDAPGDPGPGDPLVSDPLEDGSAARPFDAIQEAIFAASDGDTVLVADGTYTGTGNKDVSFGGRLITVRGAGSADACVMDFDDAEDFERGFLFLDGGDETAVLEGITIRNGGGNINFGDCQLGAALLINGADPSIVDCVFDDNGWFSSDVSPCSGTPVTVINSSSTFTGCRFVNNGLTAFISNASGGAMLVAGGAVTLVECEFIGNGVYGGCGGSGGALLINGGALTATRCTFVANGAGGGSCGGDSRGEGGAVYGGGTSRDCLFLGNRVTAGTSGSGLARGGAGYGDSSFTQCLFVGNYARNSSGGGSALGGATDGGSLVQCTLVANEALLAGADGGAVTNGTLLNCIASGNTPNQLGLGADATSSLVEGGFPGIGILDAEPALVRQPDPGPDGVWQTGDDDYGDLRLRPGSPAIDAGSNRLVPPDVTADLDGRPRFADDPGTIDAGEPDCVNPAVDLGAFEFPGFTPLPADVDGNDVVDTDDVVAVIGSFGPCAGCPADVDRSGVVDIDDVIAAILRWSCTLALCPPGGDCNGNGVDDTTDLFLCTSADANGNGIPDECER